MNSKDPTCDSTAGSYYGRRISTEPQPIEYTLHKGVLTLYRCRQLLIMVAAYALYQRRRAVVLAAVAGLVLVAVMGFAIRTISSLSFGCRRSGHARHVSSYPWTASEEADTEEARENNGGSSPGIRGGVATGDREPSRNPVCRRRNGR